MPKKERRKLTEPELKQLEMMSGLGLNLEKCAILLGMHEDTLLRMLKKDPAVRAVIAQGKAKASLMPRKAGYDIACGYTEVLLDGTKVKHPPDPVMLKFWLSTREGFKMADRLELSGPNGGPIEQTQISKEDLKARVLALRKINDLTDDE